MRRRSGYFTTDTGSELLEGDRVRGSLLGHVFTGTVAFDEKYWYLDNDLKGDSSPDLLEFDSLIRLDTEDLND